MADTVYCYPDSNVLRNRLNIADRDELLRVEADITGERLAELQINPVQGCFDFKHLCDIHKRIFQDLFTWAGEPRTVDIGKGNLFCRVQHIASCAQDIFSSYYRDCVSARNDRAQREFARELCCKCGYMFDLTHTNHEEMLNASIRSFNTDNAELERIFSKAVMPNLLNFYKFKENY